MTDTTSWQQKALYLNTNRKPVSFARLKEASLEAEDLISGILAVSKNLLEYGRVAEMADNGQVRLINVAALRLEEIALSLSPNKEQHPSITVETPQCDECRNAMGKSP